MEKEVEALKSKAVADASPKQEEPAESTAKPEISFETFLSLDIRVARVTSAEPVPKTDKLLKLVLELENGEERTVVSGIRAWYDPERLVGQQVVYLANLKPRKMRFGTSQGMLLAASDGNDILLLGVDGEPSEGSTVS